MSSPLPSRAWLQADPDRLDRFADELDDLVGRLRRVRAVPGAIDELRAQAAAARAAAHDVRELELAYPPRRRRPAS